MKTVVTLLATMCLLSGCAVFKVPAHTPNGPTIPTGTYDSESEKWADEVLSAKRKTDEEKTEKDLRKLDRN